MTVNEDGVHSCFECNVLHHALFPAYATEIPETNISVISDIESAMSTMENSNGEADFLMLAPTEDDMNMEVAQSGNEKASGAVSTNVDKGPMSNTVPADNISLVKNPDKAIRDLRAMVEELQQANIDTLQELSQMKREVISLKRRRVDSAGNSEATSVTTRSSNTSSSNSRAREDDNRYGGDSCQEAAYQSSLPARGPAMGDLPDHLKDTAFFYPWRKQSTKSPLQRARTIPKLEKQGIAFDILEEMSSNQVMEWLCIVASLLYNCNTNSMLPDWVPAEYLACPLNLALEKLDSLSPAAYFCMLRRPQFFSHDRLGVAASFYCTPQTLPRGDNPVTVMMGARGLYKGYRFGARNVVNTIRDRRELEGVRQDPPEAAIDPLQDQAHHADLRELLTPKKPDLRDNIKGKQLPAAPVKKELVKTVPIKKVPKMILVPVDPSYQGPYARYGTDLFDIRERTKLDAAKKKEEEAKEALKKAEEERNEEETREADRKIRELTRYRDALVRECSTSKPTGSHGAARPRKRTRSPTPPSRSSHPPPSASRTPTPSSRRRETARSGKGKGGRMSYSRSHSPRHHPREPRPSAKTVPGLCLGQKKDRQRSQRRREFSPSRTPPRRQRSPSGSPPWQTSQRRRRRGRS